MRLCIAGAGSLVSRLHSFRVSLCFSFVLWEDRNQGFIVVCRLLTVCLQEDRSIQCATILTEGRVCLMITSVLRTSTARSIHEDADRTIFVKLPFWDGQVDFYTDNPDKMSALIVVLTAR